MGIASGFEGMDLATWNERTQLESVWLMVAVRNYQVVELVAFGVLRMTLLLGSKWAARQLDTMEARYNLTCKGFEKQGQFSLS